MAEQQRNNLPEQVKWETGIYQLETTDLAEGGPNGVMNTQAKELANRTVYLKQLCDQLAAAIPGTEQFDAIIQQLASLDVSKVERRTDHLERVVGDLALALDANMMYPDADALVVENFDNPDQVDMMEAQVISVVSGDDSIDLVDSTGIVIGAYYMLTDGENQEMIKTKSLHVAGGTHRVILEAPVVNQYVSGRAKIYRSSVAIYDGKAWGGGNIKTDMWTPGETWKGSTTAQPVSGAVTYASQSDFTVTGAVFENGKMILGSESVGIALVATGGGAGTWQQVNAGGDNK